MNSGSIQREDHPSTRGPSLAGLVYDDTYPDFLPLRLKGALNFRDLGGLTTADGRHTRYRRLFRSDTLQELTEEDVELLRDYLGVGFVVDLRDADEAVSEGRGRLGRLRVAYANIPLAESDPVVDSSDNPLPSLYRRYLDRDENLPIAVSIAMTALARCPTVLHCAAGKDRTGVVGALLLSIAGVTRDAVVGDYMKSGPNMERVIERFRRMPRYRTSIDSLPPRVLCCEEQVILGLMQGLDERYGGARQWALQKGISKEAIASLEDVLLEP